MIGLLITFVIFAGLIFFANRFHKKARQVYIEAPSAYEEMVKQGYSFRYIEEQRKISFLIRYTGFKSYDSAKFFLDAATQEHIFILTEEEYKVVIRDLVNIYTTAKLPKLPKEEQAVEF